MTILYKLTDSEGFTRRGRDNECKWGEGVSHSGTGKGQLCGRGYIHAYTHPLLAVLLNPIHANIKNPLLWECEGEVALSDRELKVGCVTLTTVRQIPLPQITLKQRIKFAILCANRVAHAPEWNEWADKWLTGADRGRNGRGRVLLTAVPAVTNAAAYEAYLAIEAAYAAAYEAYLAREAAYAAANAVTNAAAYEAYLAREAAYAAAYEAYLAREAAYAAANAAAIAADRKTPLDLISIAEEACK